jgi:AraC-like DNA-binding protein
LQNKLAKPVFSSKGLTQVLETEDFDAWSSVLGAQLGEHRSHLQTPASSFICRIHHGDGAGLPLLHLHGSSKIALHRVQAPTHAVLWLPLHGLSLEEVNGTEHVAQPGMAMLLRPGDVLNGQTSRQIEGISILLPADRVRPGLPTLLHRGPADRALILAANAFAQVTAAPKLGSAHAGAALLDALETWQLAMERKRDGQPEPVKAQRRRQTVADARQWMLEHLDEAFEISAVAKAVAVSIRTLQYAFLQELGLTPMAEAKRLRLQHLHQLLLDSSLSHMSIAELMVSCGLLACGSTSAAYCHYFGETPRQTRLAPLT